MKHKVSIITCCYNCQEFFHETRDSVINQTSGDWEHVCVDDASTDGTWEILQEYQRRFPDKVKIYRNQYVDGKKRRPYPIALDLCSGDLLQKLDHDDFLSPDYIEKAIKRIDETGADAVVPRLVDFDHLTREEREHAAPFGDNLSMVISGREAAMLSLDWTVHGDAVWRMGIVRKVDFAPPGEWAFDEYERIQRLRYMECGTVAFFTGKFYYRQIASSGVHRPWGRYNHRRLYTNRSVLQALIRGNYPEQIIDYYRVKTYRLICSSYTRFVMSKVYRNAQQRRDVRREIRAVYDDVCALDKAKLRKLCPSVLDWLRLRFFYLIVPITFWRKLLNRVLRNERIF